MDSATELAPGPGRTRSLCSKCGTWYEHDSVREPGHACFACLYEAVGDMDPRDIADALADQRELTMEVWHLRSRVDDLHEQLGAAADKARRRADHLARAVARLALAATQLWGASHERRHPYPHPVPRPPAIARAARELLAVARDCYPEGAAGNILRRIAGELGEVLTPVEVEASNACQCDSWVGLAPWWGCPAPHVGRRRRDG